MLRLLRPPLILLMFYGAVLGGLALWQRRLIYFPDTQRPDPDLAGLRALQVEQVGTADGLRLLAWYVPPPRPDAYVVLYLHGNAGNIADRVERLRQMAAQGWGVLLPEYRGYGGNPGSPSEAGLTEDARAAYAQLRRRGVPRERILLWGESLGTGLAVRLATEQNVAALLLESPYTSVAELARRSFPWVPVNLLLRDRFDSLSRIGAVTAPVLVMQGAQDRLVPPEMGQRLLASATAPKELWVAPRAGHNDLPAASVVTAAAAFMRRHLPP